MPARTYINSQTHHETLKTDSFFTNILVPIALLLVLGATAVPFFLRDVELARTAFPYIFAAGALLLLVARLFTPYRGSDARLKRLHRIEAWSALFFCAAAFFLFYNPYQLRDWLAFTLAGAVIQIITSIAIPLRESKLAGKK